MKELSLNILDITENSVKAGASLTKITIDETSDDKLIITINDNGCGMDAEMLKNVTDPFFTTRTTRNVGLGIPLIKLEAEQTGGSFSITSRDVKNYPDLHGTELTATFYKNHIDFTPLGDIVATVTTLIQGHEDTDFEFLHKFPNGEVTLKTAELREQLGDIPLGTYEVINWVGEYLKEQYTETMK